MKDITRKLIIGVDPGIHGALGVVQVFEDGSYKFLDAFDFPKFETADGKTRIDLYQLAFAVERYSSDTIIAIIEEVGRMPTNQGPLNAFTMGHATGSITGILAGLMVTIHTVAPNIWKLSLGLSSNKQSSIEMALREFPEAKKHIYLKKHDGRAEALLLALWGIKNMRRKK